MRRAEAFANKDKEVAAVQGAGPGVLHPAKVLRKRKEERRRKKKKEGGREKGKKKEKEKEIAY